MQSVASLRGGMAWLLSGGTTRHLHQRALRLGQLGKGLTLSPSLRLCSWSCLTKLRSQWMLAPSATSRSWVKKTTSVSSVVAVLLRQRLLLRRQGQPQWWLLLQCQKLQFSVDLLQRRRRQPGACSWGAQDVNGRIAVAPCAGTWSGGSAALLARQLGRQHFQLVACTTAKR